MSIKNRSSKLNFFIRIPFIFLIVFSFQCQSTANQNAGSDYTKSEKISSQPVMRALYIPNHKSRNLKFITALVEKGQPHGINMLVFDVHTFGSSVLKVNSRVIDFLKSRNIYVAGRVVCFQDGIDKLPVPAAKVKALGELVSSASDSGFDEIQLDYIRFIDGKVSQPLKRKYAVIEDFLKSFRAITDKRNIKLSADVFGRVVYNQNDQIGQKLEIFAAHTDVIYPMLYPSHFNMDRKKMSEPGETVKEGTLKGLKRLEGTKVHLQPYIQAFPYNIQYARVKLDRYVALQINGVEDTGARGWVAWNPNGDYSSVFSALNIIKTENNQKNQNKQPLTE